MRGVGGVVDGDTAVADAVLFAVFLEGVQGVGVAGDDGRGGSVECGQIQIARMVARVVA